MNFYSKSRRSGRLENEVSDSEKLRTENDIELYKTGIRYGIVAH